MSDRTVHTQSGEEFLVRYDRAGAMRLDLAALIIGLLLGWLSCRVGLG